MAGVTLSRWTMGYFAAALLALLTAELLMASGYGYPAAPLRAPETLVLVHIVTIGWLSLLMCGALFQFVPVLVARPLHNDWLPLPALVCLVAGLGFLILGFLRLGGQIAWPLPFLGIAGGLLGLGFAVALWNLARTLWPARPLPLAARFVAVGLMSVAATVALGIVFALALDGVASAGPVAALVGEALPLHVVAGLGGWLSFTAMGVSYRLLAMFMLAPELDNARSRAVLRLGAAALATAVLGGVVSLWLGQGVTAALAAGGLLGLAAVALYGADIVHLYRARKRRRIELNSRMATLALASLAGGVALLVGLLAFGRLGEQVAAPTFLLAFGWISGLGLAKLYKIVAFLTWLECYGPVLGKMPTPRVQDLVVEARSRKWFVGYFIAVWGATLALLLPHDGGFRLMAAAMALSTVGIVFELTRIRRLADVAPPAGSAPPATRRPRLLLIQPR
jgi:hypothetical protein